MTQAKPCFAEAAPQLKGLCDQNDTCPIPDDCIDYRRYPLFLARSVMRGLMDELKDRVRGTP